MPPVELPLSDTQRDALQVVARSAMQGSADVLSDLTLRTVRLGEPSIAGSTWSQLQEQFQEPLVVVQVEYTSGLQGSNLLLMRPAGAARVAALMMGENPAEAGTLDELHLSALAEALNQMVGASSTALSDLFGRQILVAPPVTRLRPLLLDGEAPLDGSGHAADPVVIVTFDLQVDDDSAGAIDSRIVQIFPPAFASRLADDYIALQAAAVAPHAAPAAPVRARVQPEEPAPAPATAAAWVAESLGEARDADRIPMELIKRVTVPITVRLGQTRLSLQDVLALTRGSIVALDTTDGEPVDVLVSGTLVARGEVVVVREHFGVRITELIQSDQAPPAGP